MGNDDRLRLDTSAARRHLADCTPAQIETFRQGANDACIDCADVPLAGGARCLPCCLKVAAPKSASSCGTAAGYRQHFRVGQKPCRRCREANARYRQRV